MDFIKPIADAEREINARIEHRKRTQFEFRSPEALEIIADELTRLRAEKVVERALRATAAGRR